MPRSFPPIDLRLYQRPTACVLSTLILAWAAFALVVRAEDAPAAAVALDDLADKLEQATEGRLDIDLKSGKSYVRCKLLKLTRDKNGKAIRLIKFQDSESAKPVTVNFSSIRSLVLDREQVYEARGSSKKVGKEAIVERELKSSAADREKWVAKAKEHGIQPWPELSTKEHQAAEKKTREQMGKMQAMFPGLALYETHEFFFLSDMPPEQVTPYAASLDRMYDLMCGMYGIRKGAAVWKGKCLVVAFAQQGDFLKFEEAFFQNRPPENVQGLCHQNSAGDVAMACYRGDSPEYFGQVLVHETSHGFIHRYRTAARLPSWANEGMADWIAQALVSYDNGVARKRELALAAMRQSHSLQGLFQPGQITALHYGMATNLTDFLIQKDKKKYAQWVNGMKEGQTWQESLKAAYGATPEQLVTAFGQAIDVPDLQP